MITITGGAGFLGRAVVAAAQAVGESVRVVSRRPPDAFLGVESVAADLADVDSLERAFRGSDVVIHAAAVTPSRGADEASMRAVNVVGAKNAVEAAARVGVGRFVHVGSAGVYGDGDGGVRPHSETDEPRPRDAYERSKLDGERAVIEAARVARLPWVVLRPSGVFGQARPETVRFHREAAAKRVRMFGPPQVWLSPIHAEDAARAAVLAARGDAVVGEIINIAGERVELGDLVMRAAAVAGRRPLCIVVPRLVGAIGAPLLRLLGRKDAAERWARGVVNRASDSEKAARLLGFRAASLDARLRETQRAITNPPPTP